MVAYAIGLSLLKQDILEITSSNKIYSNKIEYPDCLTAAGSIEDITCYWEHLINLLHFSFIIQKYQNPT